MTQDLMSDRAVSDARELYYRKLANGDIPDVTNYGARFGVTGYIESGNPFSSNFSPARFFVGSSTISITTVNNDSLQFRLANDTSVTSAMHQFGFGTYLPEVPSWSRPYPMGTTRQTYTWTEPRRQ
jgi:hypothetical protein